MKVSGHWTIEVRDPDGRLVNRHEFENALETNGGEWPVRFLARNQTPGLWHINLYDPSADGPCFVSVPTACVTTESASTSAALNYFKTLEVSVPTPLIMRLSGTVTAERNGKISVVQTMVATCPNTTAPASPCTSTTVHVFTTKTLTTPVSVLLNQQVAVTADIGFN